MESNTKYVGVSPFFLMFMVFLVLKLTNTVTWSWWIITLPMWIGIPIFIVFILIIYIIVFINALIN